MRILGIFRFPPRVRCALHVSNEIHGSRSRIASHADLLLSSCLATKSTNCMIYTREFCTTHTHIGYVPRSLTAGEGCRSTVPSRVSRILPCHPRVHAQSADCAGNLESEDGAAQSAEFANSQNAWNILNEVQCCSAG